MGRTECLTWVDYERAVVGTALFSESEMALFSERTHTYAQKTLDTADIVREAMLQEIFEMSADAGKPGVQFSSPTTPSIPSSNFTGS